MATAALTRAALGSAEIVVGLSWPNLAKALGRPADPRRWAVLYLGAATAASLPKDRELTLLDGKNAPLPEQERALAEIDAAGAETVRLFLRAMIDRDDPDKVLETIFKNASAKE